MDETSAKAAPAPETYLPENTAPEAPAHQTLAEAAPSEADLFQVGLVEGLKALASEQRLAVLAWLRAPKQHFPPQKDGDLIADGVCGVNLAAKLGVSQPTLHRHMQVLVGSGLVQARRIRQWTFYRRDEARIAGLVRRIGVEI